MIQQFLFITSISLFDTFSTTLQIVLFIILLATKKPSQTALSYLLGLMVVYFASGLLIFQHIDAFNEFVRSLFPSLAHMPDAQYYSSELLMGLFFAAMGPIYHIMMQKKKAVRKPNPFLGMLSRINPVVAFVLGALFSVSNIPGSFPYLAALEKLHHDGIGYSHVVGWILYYNVVYMLPMLAAYAFFVFLRNTVSDVEKKLHIHAENINMVMTAVMISLMGLFGVLDAAGYFLFNHPLVPNKFF